MARRHGNLDDADNTRLAKAEIPCKNRGFRDWDRSDLNREPKDYESLSGQGLKGIEDGSCGKCDFQVAPKVALATAENDCESLTTDDDSDRQSSPLAVPIDPDLAKIVAAWSMLAEPLKRAVLALVGNADDSSDAVGSRGASFDRSRRTADRPTKGHR